MDSLRDKFEKTLADFLSREFCLSVSTCRVALYYSLQALELEEDDEVLLAPINIPDIVNSILALKLNPVFVDLSLRDQCVCVESLKGSITNKTRVLLLTYLGGLSSSDVKEIADFCSEKNIIIIEDFSQFMAPVQSSFSPGKVGEISICSLSNGKTISTLVGGAIVTDNKTLAEKLKKIDEDQSKSLISKRALLLQHLELIVIMIATTKLVFKFLTFPLIKILSARSNNEVHNLLLPSSNSSWELAFSNERVQRQELPAEYFFSLCDWQFELGLWCLQRVEDSNQKRRVLSLYLYEKLSEKAKSFLPKDMFSDNQNTYYHFPIYPSQPDVFRAKMLEAGIDMSGYGLALNSEEKCFAKFNRDTPQAKYIKNNCLFLPVHESMKNAYIEHIANCVNKLIA